MFMRRLLIGLMLSLFGSALFTFWLSTKLRRQPDAKLHYLAPVANVEAGQTLSKETLKAVDWPASMPLTGAFTKPDDLIGRTVLYPVAAGEPILDRTLAAAGSGAGLSTHIPDGMRAISLKSDAVTGVAGFLMPGTHVDVLVTYRESNDDGSQGAMVTSTVLQDVPILTAGQQMQPDPSGKPAPADVVTLLVTPVDAEKATLASTQGTIHFIMRNAGDHDKVDDTPLALVAFDGRNPQLHATASPRGLQPMRRGLLTGPQTMPGFNPNMASARPPAEPKPAPKGYQVQMITGNKSTVESF